MDVRSSARRRKLVDVRVAGENLIVVEPMTKTGATLTMAMRVAKRIAATSIVLLSLPSGDHLLGLGTSLAVRKQIANK